MEYKTVPITSPKGTAQWPKLSEPDFKFKAEGEYSINLLLNPAEAEGFTEKVTGILQTYYKEQCATLRKSSLKMADLPWKNDTSKDGSETGLLRIKFSMKASWLNKDGSKGGERKPAIFDSKGGVFAGPVGGGSTVRVAADINPWYSPALGCGVSLRLRAVQVLELRAPSGPTNSAAYGFTTEEEGFVGGESLPDSVFKSSTVSVSAAAGNGGSDF